MTEPAIVLDNVDLSLGAGAARVHILKRLSLTVAAQPLLNDVGVRDIKDLQILTPGLVVASTSNQTFTTARIRGADIP